MNGVPGVLLKRMNRSSSRCAASGMGVFPSFSRKTTVSTSHHLIFEAFHVVYLLKLPMPFQSNEVPNVDLRGDVFYELWSRTATSLAEHSPAIQIALRPMTGHSATLFDSSSSARNTNSPAECGNCESEFEPVGSATNVGSRKPSANHERK